MGKESTSNRQRCIFCGSDENKRSREHIFRSALRKYGPDDLATVFENFHTGEKRELRESIFDQVLRKVCKQCNEGWMHDLEVEVEPVLGSLMLGQETVISPDAASALARWAAKTNIVRGHAARSSAVPPAVAATIRNQSQVSPDWVVALWRYSDATATDRLRHFEHDIYTYAADDPVQAKTHHGRVRAQEHILVLGKSVIYSRFTKDPDEFSGGLARCWGQALKDVDLSPVYLATSPLTEMTTHELPLLEAGELWKLSSLLPSAYRYASGRKWKGESYE